MEPEMNCSSQCDSALCFIHAGLNRQEGLEVMQRLCGLSTLAVELPRRALSPVLRAVMWTLLSCGILLAVLFLSFTLRFRNNRIVKMSSPNLNLLTLLGSVLTYTSGFLFALVEGASPALLQARMWTLCVGSTLVFGPILGKTWRLYRVFTQRVPDKRVIIRDIQLMGLVALLILVDMLILTTWSLTDPSRCSRSLAAVVKVMQRHVSYSLAQTDACSSLYSDLWVTIIAVKKGCLLLYGTYLAGLTSNVSHPPVNQSPTILTVVTLVTISSTVALPVSVFLQAWPNVVYSTVAGAIFVCTLASNCMLFVPQLTQWHHFEEDQNNPTQMAKYFSSPSRSQPSVCSQEEIYYLLGENNSMKKLLTEKNAVIDSLQEQVSNAKDKLLRLMATSQPAEEQEQDLDSSNTNLNSTSTQITELQSDGLCASSLPQREAESQRTRACPSSPCAPAAAESGTPPSGPAIAHNSSSHLARSPPPLSAGICRENWSGSSPGPAPGPCPGPGPPGRGPVESRAVAAAAAAAKPTSQQQTGCLRTSEETVTFVTSLQSRQGLNPLQRGLGRTARPTGFVSSEQLQEILQELSIDAVESSLRSPGQMSRASTHFKFAEPAALSPLSLRTPRSPHPPVIFRYPSISPYMMRKRRPPFHSSRRGLACFHRGSEALGRGRGKDQCEAHKHAGGLPVGDTRIQAEDNGELEEEREQGVGVNGATRRHQRCVLKSNRCSALPCSCCNHGNAFGPCDNEHGHTHAGDSCWSWDSDSSSSTDDCYYHRPYCEACLQRASLVSSGSSSDSSDSEYEGYSSPYGCPHPVVFKEDIKPTFV